MHQLIGLSSQGYTFTLTKTCWKSHAGKESNVLALRNDYLQSIVSIQKSQSLSRQALSKLRNLQSYRDLSKEKCILHFFFPRDNNHFPKLAVLKIDSGNQHRTASLAYPDSPNLHPVYTLHHTQHGLAFCCYLFFMSLLTLPPPISPINSKPPLFYHQCPLACRTKCTQKVFVY